MLEMHTLERPNVGWGTQPETFDTTSTSVVVETADHAARWIKNRMVLGTSMITETVMIYPEAARFIIENHTVLNRSLKPKKLTLMARDMRAGQWKLTSQGISFDENGKINNGHHRLNACIYSKGPFVTRVTFGERRDVFDVLDTGSLRSSGDTLAVSGYKNVNILAASARLLNYINTNATNVTNDEVLRIVHRHPRLADASANAQIIAHKFRCQPRSAALALYLISTNTEHSQMLPVFLDKLLTGSSLPSGDPILCLREGLIARKFGMTTVSVVDRAVVVSACIVKAWNAFVRGQSVKFLRSAANEKFPEIA